MSHHTNGATERTDCACSDERIEETHEADIEQFLCPVDQAAQIIGQKWTLQIVHDLLGCRSRRFCELQEALGGVNPSTLSSRLKMLEEEGIVRRSQISAIPPHVEYSLTRMGSELVNTIDEITKWSNRWLCRVDAQAARSASGSSQDEPAMVST